MILIVGRSGVGKDYLADKLREKGFDIVKSYTTRPRRSAAEDTHWFLLQETADNMLDKVATTTINGYEYFTTVSQINGYMKSKKSAYIIDKEGIDCLLNHFDPKDFTILYLTADLDEARSHAIARADDPNKERAIFAKRRMAEDAEFIAFDREIRNESYKGISVWKVENDYTEERMNTILKLIDRTRMH